MMKRSIPLLVTLFFLLSACQAPEWGSTLDITMTPLTASDTLVERTDTDTPTPTLTPIVSLTSTPTLAADAWKSMPVVPGVSERMIQVYQAGLAAGRDPDRFSKIGDCQNITTYFLASFDKPNDYRLGLDYAYLQPTIDHFAGSWSRQSLAVKGGLNVAAALNPFWADPHSCESGETPVACEIRVYNPSIAIISMEESWSGDIDKYDRYLRQIVEYVLSQNVVPILATRAEPEHSQISINETVARIAYDYQVPLWNFWAAAYPLPGHGLLEDGFHLSQSRSFFDDPVRMRAGWPWRNLTALQAMDAVWHGVTEQP